MICAMLIRGTHTPFCRGKCVACRVEEEKQSPPRTTVYVMSLLTGSGVVPTPLLPAVLASSQPCFAYKSVLGPKERSPIGVKLPHVFLVCARYCLDSCCMSSSASPHPAMQAACQLGNVRSMRHKSVARCQTRSSLGFIHCCA